MAQARALAVRWGQAGPWAQAGTWEQSWAHGPSRALTPSRALGPGPALDFLRWMQELLQTPPGPFYKDAHRISVPNGGWDTSIALI